MSLIESPFEVLVLSEMHPDRKTFSKSTERAFQGLLKLIEKKVNDGNSLDAIFVDSLVSRVRKIEYLKDEVKQEDLLETGHEFESQFEIAEEILGRLYNASPETKVYITMSDDDTANIRRWVHKELTRRKDYWARLSKGIKKFVSKEEKRIKKYEQGQKKLQNLIKTKGKLKKPETTKKRGEDINNLETWLKKKGKTIENIRKRINSYDNFQTQGEEMWRRPRREDPRHRKTTLEISEKYIQKYNKICSRISSEGNVIFIPHSANFEITNGKEKIRLMPEEEPIENVEGVSLHFAHYRHFTDTPIKNYLKKEEEWIMDMISGAGPVPDITLLSGHSGVWQTSVFRKAAPKKRHFPTDPTKKVKKEKTHGYVILSSAPVFEDGSVIKNLPEYGDKEFAGKPTGLSKAPVVDRWLKNDACPGVLFLGVQEDGRPYVEARSIKNLEGLVNESGEYDKRPIRLQSDEHLLGPFTSYWTFWGHCEWTKKEPPLAMILGGDELEGNYWKTTGGQYNAMTPSQASKIADKFIANLMEKRGEKISEDQVMVHFDEWSLRNLRQLMISLSKEHTYTNVMDQLKEFKNTVIPGLINTIKNSPLKHALSVFEGTHTMKTSGDIGFYESDLIEWIFEILEAVDENFKNRVAAVREGDFGAGAIYNYGIDVNDKEYLKPMNLFCIHGSKTKGGSIMRGVNDTIKKTCPGETINVAIIGHYHTLKLGGYGIGDNDFRLFQVLPTLCKGLTGHGYYKPLPLPILGSLDWYPQKTGPDGQAHKIIMNLSDYITTQLTDKYLKEWAKEMADKAKQ